MITDKQLEAALNAYYFDPDESYTEHINAMRAAIEAAEKVKEMETTIEESGCSNIIELLNDFNEALEAMRNKKKT